MRDERTPAERRIAELEAKGVRRAVVSRDRLSAEDDEPRVPSAPESFTRGVNRRRVGGAEAADERGQLLADMLVDPPFSAPARDESQGEAPVQHPKADAAREPAREQKPPRRPRAKRGHPRSPRGTEKPKKGPVEQRADRRRAPVAGSVVRRIEAGLREIVELEAEAHRLLERRPVEVVRTRNGV
jgi:hypothetical protein